MSNIHYFILAFLSLTVNVVSASPRWVEKKPTGRSHVYAVGLGESTTSLSEARKGAITSAMSAFNAAEGVTITSRMQLKKIEDSTSYRESVVDELVVGGASSTLYGLQIVETSLESNTSPYRMWALVSLPSQNKISYWSPVWRSLIIPGWGQYYQGKSWRGATLLLGEVASVGGAYFTANEYTDRKSKANHSNLLSTRNDYNRQADTYYQANVVCVCAAAALYGLSLADILFFTNNRADIYYSATLTPQSKSLSPGVLFTFTFPLQTHK